MTSQLSKQENFRLLFNNTCKPIIGMIHLPALPGVFNHHLSLNDIISFALSDLNSLIVGGVDGILVENYHDYPYNKNSINKDSLISMAIIIREIVLKSTIPVGINVLRNACTEALLLSTLLGGKFIRCNFLTGAYVTDQGIIEGCANELKKLQMELGLKSDYSNQLIFADVHCKHASPLTNRDIILDALDTFERGCADAIIITGERTGMEANLDELKKLKSKNLHPVIVGSGINEKNISKFLRYSDGAIIGTAFKENNNISNPVDKKKVKLLMEKVKQIMAI